MLASAQKLVSGDLEKNKSKPIVPGTIPSYPKIQIEHKEDILFVQQSIKDAIQATLDLKKKSWIENYELNEMNQQDKDSLSSQEIFNQIELEAYKWVKDIFELASPNIMINGLDYQEAFKIKEEYEPFNDSLVEEAEQLHQEMTTNLVQFTILRKQVLKQIQMLSKSAELRSVENRQNILKQLAQLAGDDQEGDQKMVPEQNSHEFKEYMNQLNLNDVVDELKLIKSTLEQTKQTVDPMVQKLQKAQGLLDELGIENDTTSHIKIPEQADDMMIDLEEEHCSHENHLGSMQVDNNLTPRTARSGFLNQLKRS